MLAQLPLARLLALASKSMPAPGKSVRACDELRSAINGVDHAPTELVLTRQCADVSKLMYHNAHQWGHSGS